jgi:hypothetical protein
MPRTTRSLALLAAAAFVVACAPSDPAARVERERARYSAEISGSGFVVKDVPGHERPEVLLDVLLRNDGRGTLPGVTLDISMAGPGGAEKTHRRVYVDARGADPGGKQVSLTLEDLPYEQGDGFSVEVRSAVPPADRGEYREFATSAGGAAS